MEYSNISIIMPTYKRDKEMLKRAIQSILDQTYKNYEIIIVDDNNKDDQYYKETVECSKDYTYCANIKFIYHDTNKGANVARNTGIRNSKYEVLAFLDSDDEWKKNYLELMISKMQKKEIGLCYAGYNVINEKTIETVNCNGLEGNIFEKEIILDRISPTSCVMIKKECVHNTGEFDNELPARQDFDMWVRITRKYEVATVKQPLVKIYRNGHESISSNPNKRINGTKRVYEKILASLTEEEKKQYEKKINWAKNKTISEIYIQNRSYDEAIPYIKETLKYGRDIKLCIKMIVIKMKFYDVLVKIKRMTQKHM